MAQYWYDPADYDIGETPDIFTPYSGNTGTVTVHEINGKKCFLLDSRQSDSSLYNQWSLPPTSEDADLYVELDQVSGNSSQHYYLASMVRAKDEGDGRKSGLRYEHRGAGTSRLRLVLDTSGPGDQLGDSYNFRQYSGLVKTKITAQGSSIFAQVDAAEGNGAISITNETLISDGIAVGVRGQAIYVFGIGVGTDGDSAPTTKPTQYFEAFLDDPVNTFPSQWGANGRSTPYATIVDDPSAPFGRKLHIPRYHGDGGRWLWHKELQDAGEGETHIVLCFRSPTSHWYPPRIASGVSSFTEGQGSASNTSGYFMGYWSSSNHAIFQAPQTSIQAGGRSEDLESGEWWITEARINNETDFLAVRSYRYGTEPTASWNEINHGANSTGSSWAIHIENLSNPSTTDIGFISIGTHGLPALMSPDRDTYTAGTTRTLGLVSNKEAHFDNRPTPLSNSTRATVIGYSGEETHDANTEQHFLNTKHGEWTSERVAIGDPGGSADYYVPNFAAAIDYAIDNKSGIIIYPYDDAWDRRAEFLRAYEAGIVCFVAHGSNGAERLEYPPRLTTAIQVGGENPDTPGHDRSWGPGLEFDVGTTTGSTSQSNTCGAAAGVFTRFVEDLSDNNRWNARSRMRAVAGDEWNEVGGYGFIPHDALPHTEIQLQPPVDIEITPLGSNNYKIEWVDFWTSNASGVEIEVGGEVIHTATLSNTKQSHEFHAIPPFTARMYTVDGNGNRSREQTHAAVRQERTLNRKMLVIEHGDSNIQHGINVRNNFNISASSSWQKDVAQVGATGSYDHVVVYPATFFEAANFAIENGYDIAVHAYSGWDYPILEHLADGGVSMFKAYNGNTHRRYPYLDRITRTFTVAGGNNTQNTTAYGPGLEFFDTHGSSSSQSYSMPRLAGRYSRFLDQGLTPFDARQATREQASYYDNWTELNGYGRVGDVYPTINPLELDLMPPLDNRVKTDDGRGVVYISWVNSETTRWARTVITDGNDNVLYRGVETKLTLELPPGEHEFRFYSEDTEGNRSPLPEHAVRTVTLHKEAVSESFDSLDEAVWRSDNSYRENVTVDSGRARFRAIDDNPIAATLQTARSFGDFDMRFDLDMHPNMALTVGVRGIKESVGISTPEGYQVMFYPEALGSPVYYVANGVLSHYENDLDDANPDTWMPEARVRIRANGPLIQFKWWSRAEDEPEEWSGRIIEDTYRAGHITFGVQNVLTGDHSVYIDNLTITPLNVPQAAELEAPESLTASLLPPSTVLLNWQKALGASGYRIERRRLPGVEPAQVDPDFPNEVTADILLARTEVGGGKVEADVYLFDKYRNIQTPTTSSVTLGGVSAETIETVGVHDPTKQWPDGKMHGANVPFCYRFTWSNVPVGEHLLKASARAGDLASSDERTIEVHAAADYVVETIDDMLALDPAAGETIQVLDQKMGEDLFVVDESGVEVDTGLAFAFDSDVAEGSSVINGGSTSHQQLDHTDLVMDSVRFLHRTGGDYFEGWHFHGHHTRDHIDNYIWLRIKEGTFRQRVGALRRHANDMGDSVGDAVTVEYRYATSPRRARRNIDNLGVTCPEWWGAREADRLSGDMYWGHRMPWASYYTKLLAEEKGKTIPLRFSQMYHWTSALYVEENVPWKGYGDGTGLLAPGENSTIYWFLTVDDPNALSQLDLHPTTPVIENWERSPHNKETALGIRTPYVCNKEYDSRIELMGVEFDMNMSNNDEVYTNRTKYGGSRAGFPMDAVQNTFRHLYEGKGFKMRTGRESTIRSEAMFRFVHIHDSPNDNIGGQINLDGSHDILTGNSADNHAWYGPCGVNLQNIEFYGYSWASAWSMGGVHVRGVRYRSRGHQRNPYRGWHVFSDHRDVEGNQYALSTVKDVHLVDVDCDFEDCVNTKGGAWSGDIAADRTVRFNEWGSIRPFTIKNANIIGTSQGTFDFTQRTGGSSVTLENVSITAQTTTRVFETSLNRLTRATIKNLTLISRQGGSLGSTVISLPVNLNRGLNRHVVDGIHLIGYSPSTRAVSFSINGQPQFGKSGLHGEYRNATGVDNLINVPSTINLDVSHLVFRDTEMGDLTEQMLLSGRFRNCTSGEFQSDQVNQTYTVPLDDDGKTVIDIPTNLFARPGEMSVLGADIIDIQALTSEGSHYPGQMGTAPILRATTTAPISAGSVLTWTARVTPEDKLPDSKFFGLPPAILNRFVGDVDMLDPSTFFFNSTPISNAFTVQSSDNEVALPELLGGTLKIPYYNEGQAHIALTHLGSPHSEVVIPVNVTGDAPQVEGSITFQIGFGG